MLGRKPRLTSQEFVVGSSMPELRLLCSTHLSGGIVCGQGLFMSAEGRVYVADSVACRIRRLSTAEHTAVPITCARRMVDEVRPSGCTMYDQPTDGIDLKNSPVANNIYYNYREMFLEYVELCVCVCVVG